MKHCQNKLDKKRRFACQGQLSHGGVFEWQSRSPNLPILDRKFILTDQII